MRRVWVEAVCSREQVSHTFEGGGPQANPMDECRREGTCSAEVMFILKYLLGRPRRQSPRLRWTRGLPLNSEMTEEVERWKVLEWMKKLCDVQGFVHREQNRQPCRGPQVAERFVEALEEEFVEVGRVVSAGKLFDAHG